jgi:hypothetical protein
VIHGLAIFGVVKSIENPRTFPNMVQNPFGPPQDGGNDPFSNTSQSSQRELLLSGIDPSLEHTQDGGSTQDAAPQAPPFTSPPLPDINWDEPFANNEDDHEFDQYMRMLDNDNAAVAPAPPPVLGEALLPWSTAPPSWDPGASREAIPKALLFLYYDIPDQFRTREYWMRLVEESRKNVAITPQSWVDEMVHLLGLPNSLPELVLGWTLLSSEWRMFFLTDRSFFRPGNVTPEAWINMIQHLHITDPRTWLSNPIIPYRSRQVELGDPVNYTSHYEPVIATAAPPLRLNPQASGPIPAGVDFSIKHFQGPLSAHAHLWGNFFDDGPQKEGEGRLDAIIRIKWSRSNMGIIRRPTEKLPHLEPTSSDFGVPEVHAQRSRLGKALGTKNRRQIRAHWKKMDETSSDFDPAYRAAWRQQQKDRRAENNRRREAAYDNAARYYRHMGLPIPPKPAPPEDSDDDHFFDPADLPGTAGLHKQGKEPYRCKPCVEEEGKCSYRTTGFPCIRCINLEIEDQCVTSEPDKVKSAPFKHSFAHYDGLYIPSFALPSERLEHHVIPETWPLSGRTRGEYLPPWGATQFQLPATHNPTLTLDDAIEAVKRKVLDDGEEDHEYVEPPRKKLKPRPVRKAKVKETRQPKAKTTGTKATRKTTGTRRRLRKTKGAEAEEEEPDFEPCDNCKAIGHPDWCEKSRPCSNCTLNGKGPTCDASHQNQTYGTDPEGVEHDSDTIVVDTRFNYTEYDYQPIFGFPGRPPSPSPPPPPPPIDPDAAVPYIYMQEDVARLYETRVQIGGLPVRRPDAVEDILRAFIDQDDTLKESDPDYTPLTMIQNAEAYFQQRLAALAGQEPHLLDPGPRRLRGSGDGNVTLSESLLREAHPRMPSPRAPVTEADVLRSQAQQPHSSSQDLENLRDALEIRQTNRYEQDGDSAYPEDLLDNANDGMDWIATDHPAPLANAKNISPSNSETYRSFSDNLFQDPDDSLDPWLAEPEPPALPPLAQVTTSDIANALVIGSGFVNPVTWRLENLQEGYDVEREVHKNLKKTPHCTEDLNFWSAGSKQARPCHSANGIACDAWTCADRASCDDCWARQKSSVHFHETALVTSTKAWLCKPCKGALDRERLRDGGTLAQPRLNTCYCVSQLQETRICNVDRVEAANSIARKVAEQTALALRQGWNARCGHCRRNAEDVTTGAWRCMCCNQIVTLP